MKYFEKGRTEQIKPNYFVLLWVEGEELLNGRMSRVGWGERRLGGQKKHGSTADNREKGQGASGNRKDQKNRPDLEKFGW